MSHLSLFRNRVCSLFNVLIVLLHAESKEVTLCRWVNRWRNNIELTIKLSLRPRRMATAWSQCSLVPVDNWNIDQFDNVYYRSYINSDAGQDDSVNYFYSIPRNLHDALLISRVRLRTRNISFAYSIYFSDALAKSGRIIFMHTATRIAFQWTSIFQLANLTHHSLQTPSVSSLPIFCLHSSPVVSQNILSSQK